MSKTPLSPFSGATSRRLRCGECSEEVQIDRKDSLRTPGGSSCFKCNLCDGTTHFNSEMAAEKRSYSIRSPFSENFDANRKRANLNNSARKNSSMKSPARRETADPSDLAGIFADIEKENNEINDKNRRQTFAGDLDALNNLLNASTVSEDTGDIFPGFKPRRSSRLSGVSVESSSSSSVIIKPASKSSSKKASSASSLSRMSIESTNNNRRGTIDAANLVSLLGDIDDNAADESSNNTGAFSLMNEASNTSAADADVESLMNMSINSNAAAVAVAADDSDCDNSVMVAAAASGSNASRRKSRGDNNFNRRETVDPSNMSALLNGLDDSEDKSIDSEVNLNISAVNNSAVIMEEKEAEGEERVFVSSKKGRRRSSVSGGRKSTSSAVGTMEDNQASVVVDVSVNSIGNSSSGRRGRKSIGGSGAADCNRRETVDPSDMASLLNGLDDDSVANNDDVRSSLGLVAYAGGSAGKSSSGKRRGSSGGSVQHQQEQDRRGTIDPANMSALLNFDESVSSAQIDGGDDAGDVTEEEQDGVEPEVLDGHATEKVEQDGIEAETEVQDGVDILDVTVVDTDTDVDEASPPAALLVSVAAEEVDVQVDVQVEEAPSSINISDFENDLDFEVLTKSGVSASNKKKAKNGRKSSTGGGGSGSGSRRASLSSSYRRSSTNSTTSKANTPNDDRNNRRRETVDPTDMQSLFDTLVNDEGDNSDKKKSGSVRTSVPPSSSLASVPAIDDDGDRDRRRETADPEAMASLLRALQEEHQQEQQQQERDNANNTDGSPATAAAAGSSHAAGASAGSSVRRQSIGDANNLNRNLRRETADPDTMAELLNELRSEGENDLNLNGDDDGETIMDISSLLNGGTADVPGSSNSVVAASTVTTTAATAVAPATVRHDNGGRRDTADPSDMASLLDGLSSDNSKNTSASAYSNSNSAAAAVGRDHPRRRKSSDNRRDTVDPSDMASLLQAFDEEDGRTPTAATATAAAVPANDKNNNRRETADPADMASLLNALAEEHGPRDVDHGPRDLRRETADPASMASLLKNLADEHDTNVSVSSYSNTSLVGGGASTPDVPTDALTGRESIDTVDLMESIGDILNDFAAGGSSNKKSPTVTVASFSVSSSPLTRSRDAGLLSQDMMEEDDVSTDTMGTLELIDAVKNTVAGDENGDEGEDGLDGSQGEGEDGDTIDSMASYGSIAGLLNLQVDEAAVTNNDAKNVNKKSQQGPFSSLSPVTSTTTDTPSNTPSKLLSLNNSIAGNGAGAGAGLKSCLSSRKPAAATAAAARLSYVPPPPPSSTSTSTARKSVAFGSPNVAEFHRTSPTTSFTPMAKNQAQELFSMTGEQKPHEEEEQLQKEEDDEVTTENSRILDEWDRLTNDSGLSDDSASTVDITTTNFSASPIATTKSSSPASSSSKRNKLPKSPRSSDRRQSMLQPLLDIDDNDHVNNMADMSALSMASGTVELPGTLADLLGQEEEEDAALPDTADNFKDMDVEVEVEVQPGCLTPSAECTEELELDLHSLIRGYAGVSPGSSVKSNDDAVNLTTSTNTSAATGSSHASSVRSLGTVLLDTNASCLIGLENSHISSASVTPDRSSNSGGGDGDGPLNTMMMASGANYNDCSCYSEQPTKTVELEDGLFDIMNNMVGTVTSSSPPTTATSAAAAAAVNQYHDADQSVDVDMSGVMAATGDYTERLEGKLADLLSLVSASAAPSPTGSIRAARTSSICVNDAGDDDVEVSVDSDSRRSSMNGSRISIASTAATGPGTGTPAAADLSSASTEKLSPSSPIDDDAAVAGPVAVGGTAGRYPARRMSMRGDLSYLDLCGGSSAADDDVSNGGLVDHNNGNSIAATAGTTATAATAGTTSSKTKQTPSKAATDMLDRLRALNAGARKNTLQQCSTPLQSNAALKRLSISNSAAAAGGVKRNRLSGMFASAATASAVNQPLHSSTATTTVAVVAATTATVPALEAEEESSKNLLENVPQSIVTTAESLFAAMSMDSSILASVPALSSAILSSSLSGNAAAPSAALENLLAAANSELKANVSRTVYDSGMEVTVQEGDMDLLQTYATTCKNDVIDTWNKWEVQLFNAATSAMNQLSAVYARNLQSLQKEREEREEAGKKKNTHGPRGVAKLTGPERKAQLNSLKARILAAQALLTATRNEFDHASESCSAALEDQKNDNIRAIVQTGDVITAVEEARQRAAAEEKAAREQAHKDLQVLSAAVVDVKHSIGLINRISYCRVIEYTTTAITVEVILATKLSAKISFHLATAPAAPAADGGSGGVGAAAAIEVTGANVDILTPSGTEFYTATDKASANKDRDTWLADAFFNSVLTSNLCNGPVSERSLVQVGKPSDLPGVMHKICGYVTSLRSAYLSLKRFTEANWVWSMVEGDNIRFTNTASGAKESASVPDSVDVPLRALLADEHQKYFKTFLQKH